MIFSDTDIRIFYAFADVARNNNSFSDITLKSIAEKIGISRQAMYQSHFRSTDELLNSLYYYVDKEVKLTITKILKGTVIDKNLIEKIIHAVLPLIYEKKELFQILYSDKVNSTWSSFMEMQYSNLLSHLFRGKVYKKVVVSSNIQARIIIHEFIGLISIWMNQEKPVSPEMFEPIMIYALNNSANSIVNRSLVNSMN